MLSLCLLRVHSSHTQIPHSVDALVLVGIADALSEDSCSSETGNANCSAIAIQLKSSYSSNGFKPVFQHAHGGSREVRHVISNKTAITSVASCAVLMALAMLCFRSKCYSRGRE